MSGKITPLFNGDMVRSLRRRLSLTQEELALEVGYSERLIRKAESGHSVAPTTAADLFDFFSSRIPDLEVNNLVLDQIQVVKQIMNSYHRVGSGLVDENIHWFHSKFVFVSNGDPAEFPLAGVYRGANAFRKWLSTFEQMYQRDPDTFEIEYFQSSQAGVLASYHETYSVGSETLELLRTFLQFRFEDRLVIEINDNYDTGRNVEFWRRISS